MRVYFAITFGWWLLPLAISIAAIVWVRFKLKDEPQSAGYNFGGAVAALFYGGGAIIVIMFAWLVYFASQVLWM